MIMKTTMKILAIALVVAWSTGCSNSGGNGPVTAKVKAVEQVANYTYLLVKGKGPAYWIAVSSTDIGVGESITYEGGMLMENFYSKELDRTFEKVIFLDGVQGGSAPAMGGMQSAMGGMQGTTQAPIFRPISSKSVWKLRKVPSPLLHFMKIHHPMKERRFVCGDR